MSKDERLLAVVASVFAAAVFIGLLSVVLPIGSGAALIFLDFREDNIFPYPLTIQNMMWVVFFIGAGEVVVRMRSGWRELRQTRLELLPEEADIMLRAQDLGPIFQRTKSGHGSGNGENTPFLQRLIQRTILQFQSSRSVDQANTLMNSSLDLFMHEIDLRYNLLRYLMWLIPSLGFLGTVIGIALALNGVVTPEDGLSLEEWAKDPRMLSNVVGDMGVAFYTTLLGLLQASVLVYLVNIAQGREEMALNRAGQYCLDHLINKLYEK